MMKKKHAKKFKEVVLPQLGLTAEQFTTKSIELSASNYAEDAAASTKITALTLLQSIARKAPDKFDELFTRGLVAIGDRQKIGDFVVYNAYEVFVVHNKKLNTSVIVDVFTVEESGDFSVIGCTAEETLMLIAQFVKSELGK